MRSERHFKIITIKINPVDCLFSTFLVSSTFTQREIPGSDWRSWHNNRNENKCKPGIAGGEGRGRLFQLLFRWVQAEQWMEWGTRYMWIIPLLGGLWMLYFLWLTRRLHKTRLTVCTFPQTPRKHNEPTSIQLACLYSVDYYAII